MAQIKVAVNNIFLAFFTGLFSGLIIASTLLTILISYRMDTYYQHAKELEITIEEKNINLQKLEESINKNKYILKNIAVVLQYEGDNLDKLNLEKYIKDKYRHLLGKDINSMDPDMMAEVIDKRLIKIVDQEYLLKLSRLILAEELKIWVQVNKVN